MKYLLVTEGSKEIIEYEPADVWQAIEGLKYPDCFIALIVMENPEGPF